VTELKVIDELRAAVRSQAARWVPEKEGPRPTDTREVQQLLSSEEFATSVDRLAAKLGRPVSEVLAELVGYLRELAASHNDAVTQRWHRFGRWMLRGYDVLIDEEGLARLRVLDREHSLVFLISHRSYLDEWAFPPALVELGIGPPFGFAGANLDFFPLGSVARRTGIVHIRRTTSGEPVYKFALRAFMRHLIANRSNLIWSIEGGRSRTGKLRPPRFGLLRYVVDAVEELDDNEVLIVPVSILYDQLPTHEANLMTSEALGQGKRPEDVRWFVAYLRGLRRRLGRIYVDFGEPLPLRARLAELEHEDSHEEHVVERIAVEVCHRINRATPVTTTAAVCIALLAADRALTLEEIIDTIEPLASYLRALDWPTAGAANLMDRATVRRSLRDLVESGVLTSYQGQVTVWGVGSEQHLVAAMYRNSAVHVLIERAILEVALAEVAAGSGDRTPLHYALRARDLLKFDFFFAGRDEFAADMQAQLDLLRGSRDLTFADLSSEQAATLLYKESRLVADLVLRPFVDAYAVVADQLVEQDGLPVADRDRFISRCLIVGRQWALQRRIASEESASAEMFQTALRLASQMGLVDDTASDLFERRCAFRAELEDVRGAIDRIAGQRTRARNPETAILR
jgi:glycerol-3-phosphate O-acyltransferase